MKLEIVADQTSIDHSISVHPNEQQILIGTMPVVELIVLPLSYQISG